MMGLSPLLRSFRIRGAYTLLKRLEANMSLAWVWDSGFRVQGLGFRVCRRMVHRRKCLATVQGP